jgi:hypothetical protein
MSILDTLLDFLPKMMNFALGMVTGMVLLSAISVYFFVRGKNLDVEQVKMSSVEGDEETLIAMIEAKQAEFKKAWKEKEDGVSKIVGRLSMELVEQIATYFFPDSKHPMLELSVNELINLNHYITDRIDKMLDKPIVKNTKKIQIIKVMEMLEKKKAVEENKIVKAAQKMKLPKIMKYGGAALNAINPVYWFRKLVINTSVNAVTKKLALVVIGIVGEETVKVYSKALFETPLELDMVDDDIEKILTEDDEDEDDQ